MKALDYGFATEGVVPGCDFSGVVEIVGKTVQRVKAGDRVRLRPAYIIITYS